jgi:hypothetical protein
MFLMEKILGEQDSRMVCMREKAAAEDMSFRKVHKRVF